MALFLATFPYACRNVHLCFCSTCLGKDKFDIFSLVVVCQVLVVLLSVLATFCDLVQMYAWITYGAFNLLAHFNLHKIVFCLEDAGISSTLNGTVTHSFCGGESPVQNGLPRIFTISLCLFRSFLGAFIAYSSYATNWLWYEDDGICYV